jgi:hypothetical protein
MLYSCGNWEDAQTFAVNRDRLASTWTEFDNLIQSASIFWSAIAVDLDTTEETVDRALLLSQNAPLSLELDLRSHSMLDGEFDLSSESGQTTFRCLSILASASQRWESFSVRLNQQGYVALIKAYLPPIHAPRLRFVSIDSFVMDEEWTDRPFCGSYQALRTLELVSFPVAWLHSRELGSLISLDIKNISPLDFITSTQLADILREMRVLRDLVMGGVGLRGASPTAHPTITMNALESLHLIFIFTESEQTLKLMSVLSSIVAPRFHSLQLDGCDAFGFEIIASELQVLDLTRKFGVLKGEMDNETASSLTRRMSRVEALNLNFAPDELLQVLSSRPTSWPAIRRVDWRGIDTTSLDLYVKSREEAEMERLDDSRDN